MQYNEVLFINVSQLLNVSPDVTNAAELLGKKEIQIDKLLDKNLTFVLFSLNGGSQKDYFL